MNQFVAPQFIDVEDRIIGPITTRQFIFMVIGGIIIGVAFKYADISLAIFITIIVAILVLLFGFLKVNGRRFHEFVRSMIETIRRPRVRVWYKYVPTSQIRGQKSEEQAGVVKSDFTPTRKNIKTNHLSELALIVDTGGRYKG